MAPLAITPVSGGEALFSRSGLIVDYDIVLFEALGGLGTLAVADVEDHLVRLGIADVRIACHVDAAFFQGAGEGLGIGQDCWLIFVFEVIHLVGGHQQPQ